MKFLIQKINGEIRHDFAFTLLESNRFKNWLNRNNKKEKISAKFLNYIETVEPNDIYPIQFKPYHEKYVPVGSVEFVTDFIHHFYGLNVKPINVPEELYSPWNYAGRDIWNGNHLLLENTAGKFFVKSADKIKGFSEVVECRDTGNFGTTYSIEIPIGKYQYSNYVNGINSEWRAFVYDGKLVGLRNYCGEFTVFPNVKRIKEMIKAYKSAPVAYTLDVGVTDYDTIVIECHDFFSCGLYGFAEHPIYPNMLHKWFWQYIQREMVEQKREKL